jgi:uncharacterized protein YbjT (DUF2867 family)
VDDLAHFLVAILDTEGCDEKIVDIGGPQVLSIEDLLLSIRRALGRARAPVAHLPAGIIAACLGWTEPILRPILPITAGQLASFTNPGTVAANSWVEKQQARMKGVDEMLSASE